jgi:hypothetical protein
MSLRVRSSLVAGALALLVAGCGDDGDTTTTVSVPLTTTTPQKPAKVPPGYVRRVDTRLGYSMAVASAWKVDEQGAATLIRTRDGLVAVSISSDRTTETLSVPPDQLAEGVLAALPGYDPPLDPGPAREFGGTPFEGASATATGTLAGSKAEQRVQAIVLRSDSVNYTVVIASNAKRAPAVEQTVALRMVRTLRDYPIGAPRARS